MSNPHSPHNPYAPPPSPKAPLRAPRPAPAVDASRAVTALRAAASSLCLGLLLLVATAPSQAQVRLPALGESASDDLPVALERRYGEQVMREIRRDPDFLDDPMLLDYARSLWQPLLAAARRRGEVGADIDTAFSWELFLVRDRSVNAFALPGGHVGLHLGLMAATATADELASVLAHELSHVTQRHIARSIGNAQRQGAVGMAAMLIGILVASRTQNADVANAALASGQAAMLQGQLNFSRDMEREADRVGFGVLSDAGFAPEGMAGMFDRLEQASRLNDSGSFPYLRSHPLTGERLAEARSRVLAAPAPPRSAADAARQTLHALMQARARVLMDPNAQSWRRLRDAGTAPTARAGADAAAGLYAAALAASKLGEHELARMLAERLQGLPLLAQAPGVPALVPAAAPLLQAELALARGQADAALRHLERAAPAPPAPLTTSAAPQPAAAAAGRDLWARSLLLLRAEAAVAALQPLREASPGTDPAPARERLAGSLEALQLWVSDHAHDIGAWAALARVSDALGLRLRALRAQAEAQALRGDLGAAIDLMRRAQAASRSARGGDLFEASVIDARLREFEARRRAQLAEAREQRGRRSEGGSEGPRVNEAPHFLRSRP